jgi:hypothetical protein
LRGDGDDGGGGGVVVVVVVAVIYTIVIIIIITEGTLKAQHLKNTPPSSSHEWAHTQHSSTAFITDITTQHGLIAHDSHVVNMPIVCIAFIIIDTIANIIVIA